MSWERFEHYYIKMRVPEKDAQGILLQLILIMALALPSLEAKDQGKKISHLTELVKEKHFAEI